MKNTHTVLKPMVLEFPPKPFLAKSGWSLIKRKTLFSPKEECSTVQARDGQSTDWLKLPEPMKLTLLCDYNAFGASYY